MQRATLHQTWYMLLKSSGICGFCVSLLRKLLLVPAAGWGMYRSMLVNWVKCLCLIVSVNPYESYGSAACASVPVLHILYIAVVSLQFCIRPL